MRSWKIEEDKLKQPQIIPLEDSESDEEPLTYLENEKRLADKLQKIKEEEEIGTP